MPTETVPTETVPTETVPTETVHPRPRRRRTRRVAALLLVAAVAAGTGVGVAGPSGTTPDRSARSGLPPDVTDPEAGEGSGATEGGAEEGVPGDDGDDAPTPGAGRRLPRGDEGGREEGEEGEEAGDTASGPQPGDDAEPGPDAAPEPGPSPEPADDEPAQPVAPAALSVPAEAKLRTGVYSGSFTVANVGGEPLTWQAWPDPGVTVSVAEGTLAGGEQVVVSFTIDASQLATGPFQRRIMVDAPDVGAKDLWVKGTRPVNAIVACKPGAC